MFRLLSVSVFVFFIFYLYPQKYLNLYLYLYFFWQQTGKIVWNKKILKEDAMLVLVIKAYQRCQRLMMAFRYFRYFDENGNSEVFFPGTLWLPVWLMIQRSEFT